MVEGFDIGMYIGECKVLYFSPYLEYLASLNQDFAQVGRTELLKQYSAIP